MFVGHYHEINAFLWSNLSACELCKIPTNICGEQKKIGDKSVCVRPFQKIQRQIALLIEWS